MAGAIVSYAAKWIGTQLINEANFLFGVEDRVRDLKRELEYIAPLLRVVDSAEEGEDDQLISLFRKEILEIAFHAEDVVDNYILKVASSSNTNIDGNSLKIFPCYSCISPDVYSIGKETEAILNSIQKVVKRLEQFQNTRVIAPGEGFNKPTPQQNKMETYLYDQDEYVVGLDDVVKDLVKRLTNCREQWVMAIVGAGGIGKTTLARKISTDKRVQNRFKRVAWVTISQQWNPRDLLYEILWQTKGISHEERNSIRDWSVPEFVAAIRDFLSQRSYLLVLDDMWEREAWNCIYPALSGKRFGSKVIITTRKGDLLSHMEGNCIIYKPRLLSKEQSWELLKKIALEKKDTLATLGDDAIQLAGEMTRKCGGLPLAVVTLAGLLRTKDKYEWEGVSRRFKSLLQFPGPPQYGRSVYQMLTLSYYDLPHYLKPCFLYLSLYPEDTEIPAKMLTTLWVAEGFVPMQDKLMGVNESVEDVAEQFLSELIQRGLVQVAVKSFTTGKAKTCRMHDLTREFCSAKAEEQCSLQFFSFIHQFMTTTTSTSTQLRRVSILTSFSEVSPLLPTQDSRIRSLIQFGNMKFNVMILCENLKLLRVLILHRVKTGDGYLPKEIGNLRHLRYLALINTYIKTLPESIGNLSNLIYLEIVDYGVILPNVFWKMKSLRHLYLNSSFTCLEELKLQTLTNLQTLRTISGENWKLECELKRLSPSIKRLRVTDVMNEGMLDAFFRSPCMTSGNLVKLWLEWNHGVELKNMKPLYKHYQHLQRLKLSGNIGQDCPLIQFPTSLVRLDLYRSELDHLHDPMVVAGRLGHLKYLCLGSNAYIGAKMTCNAGFFPQLEVLNIGHLGHLEEWRVEEGAMPRLKNLRIAHCFKLNRLPEKLKFIHSLGRLWIHYMPETFCDRLFRQGEHKSYEYRAGAENRGEGGEDFHVIEHISRVVFDKPRPHISAPAAHFG